MPHTYLVLEQNEGAGGEHKYIQEYLSLITKTHPHIQTNKGKTFIFIFLITTQEKAQQKNKTKYGVCGKKH